jgi:hypothetical protein
MIVASRAAALAAIAALLGMATSARAEVFCVESVAQFQSALATAESNGVADRLLLAKPQFTAPADGFHYSNPAPGESLSVEGGYGPQCFPPAPGAKSIIAGENVTSAGALAIEANGAEIVVQDLVFTNFTAPDDGSSALNIDGDELTAIVQRNGAFLNEGALRSAISIIGANGAVIFRDNVIAGNRADGFVVLIRGRDAVPGQEMQACIVSNNTYASNLADTANGSAAFRIYGCATTIVASNIFWGNPGFDLIVDAYTMPLRLIANDVEDIVFDFGSPIEESGTLHVDPEFEVGLLNFALKSTSPLIDKGDPDEGAFGMLSDYLGLPRISGHAVDIGAIERQTDVFRDGFED